MQKMHSFSTTCTSIYAAALGLGGRVKSTLSTFTLPARSWYTYTVALELSMSRSTKLGVHDAPFLAPDSGAPWLSGAPPPDDPAPLAAAALCDKGCVLCAPVAEPRVICKPSSHLTICTARHQRRALWYLAPQRKRNSSWACLCCWTGMHVLHFHPQELDLVSVTAPAPARAQLPIQSCAAAAQSLLYTPCAHACWL